MKSPAEMDTDELRKQLAQLLDGVGAHAPADHRRRDEVLVAEEGHPPGPCGYRTHLQRRLDRSGGVRLPNAGLEIGIGLEGKHLGRPNPFGTIRGYQAETGTNLQHDIAGRQYLPDETELFPLVCAF